MGCGTGGKEGGMKRPSTIGERIVLDSIDIVEGMNRGGYRPGLECMYESTAELKSELRTQFEERPKKEVTMDFTDEFVGFIESHCRKFETPFEYALILFYQCGHTMIYAPDNRYPNNALRNLFTVFDHVADIDVPYDIRTGVEIIQGHDVTFDTKNLYLQIPDAWPLKCPFE